MKLSENIAMLAVHISIMNVNRTLHPTILWDEENLILVDVADASNLESIKQQIKDSGSDFSKLKNIICTQQDIDHTAGIRQIKKEKPDVKVLAHEADKPYIEGAKTVKRLNDTFLQRIKHMTQDEQEKIVYKFKNSFVQVDETIEDGQHFAICGGITVIHTPGHTPGHISLYHHASKTLIAGDALNILHGKLVGPNGDPMKEDSVNPDDAIDALKKLQQFDIQNIITYHGGLFADNCNEKIKEVIKHKKLYSYLK